jgi:hypothetical protein
MKQLAIIAILAVAGAILIVKGTLRFVLVLSATVMGAIVGAVAFWPVEHGIADGGPDCTTCGSFSTVLIGVTFRGPWAGEITLLVIGAVAGAVLFGGMTVAYLVSRPPRDPASAMTVARRGELG